MDLEYRGPVSMKGKAVPMEVYILTRKPVPMNGTQEAAHRLSIVTLTPSNEKEELVTNKSGDPQDPERNNDSVNVGDVALRMSKDGGDAANSNS